VSLNDTSTEHFKTLKHLFHAKRGTVIALSVQWLLYGSDDLRFDHQQKQMIFSIPKMSRIALGSMQPPIQLIPRTHSTRAKQLGHEANLRPSHFNIKNEWSYISTPSMSSWHGQGLLHLLPLPFHTTQSNYWKLAGTEKPKSFSTVLLLISYH